MRYSADQPFSRTDTRASQFSSQSTEKSESLKRTPSSSAPPALISKTKALLPSRRVSSETLTQSASTSRSRRVRRATTGAPVCSQSTPSQSAWSSYTTRTVVRSVAAAPSIGAFCVNACAAGAPRHAASSSRPSSTGGSETWTAVTCGAGRGMAGG